VHLSLTTVTGGAGGIRLFDSNVPGQVIGQTVINTYTALGVPAYRRAMAFLSENLAAFPRAVHKGGNPDDAHPVNKLLKRRPNTYQNPTQLWRALFLHAAHVGNGFVEIRRTAGRPTGLHNLIPEDVVPFRFIPETPAGDGEPQQYYFQRSADRVLPGADVLHLAGISYDGQQGVDPIILHNETLQRAKLIDRYLHRYLTRGTMMRGAIEIPYEATPEQIKTLVDLIATHFSGVDAERDIPILTGGAKLNNATLTPQDTQLAQQGAYTTKQVAQITNVPPQFLYEMGEAKYVNTVEQAGQDVVRYTFRPWIEQTEEELTTKLLSESEQDAGYAIKLDPDALLRGDTATQTTTTAAQVTAGIRTRNEARAVLGLPPNADPESDKLKTSGDTTPGGAGGAGAAAAAPPAG
jgi:HK97 family phage portal protein